jgi:hypothetical protein
MALAEGTLKLKEFGLERFPDMALLRTAGEEFWEDINGSLAVNEALLIAGDV